MSRNQGESRKNHNRTNPDPPAHPTFRGLSPLDSRNPPRSALDLMIAPSSTLPLNLQPTPKCRNLLLSRPNTERRMFPTNTYRIS